MKYYPNCMWYSLIFPVWLIMFYFIFKKSVDLDPVNWFNNTLMESWPRVCKTQIQTMKRLIFLFPQILPTSMPLAFMFCSRRVMERPIIKPQRNPEDLCTSTEAELSFDWHLTGKSKKLWCGISVLRFRIRFFLVPWSWNPQPNYILR